MADTTETTATTAEGAGAGEAKARFTKALEEARAGAQALGKEAQDRADAYREKFAGASSDWAEQAKARSEEAKAKAADLATQGKTKASEGLATLGSLISDNASLLDEKVGPKYGDYARSAAQTIQETADSLNAKDFTQLGEDAKEFVRKSPGVALGMAAVAGYMVARMFKGSRD